MKRFVVGLSVALLFALPATAQRGSDRLTGLDGGTLTSSQLSEGNTILVFWASWSPKCRNIVERLNRIQTQWGSQAKVVSVNFQEDEADVQSFLSGKNLRTPVYLDNRGAFSRRHAVTDLPGLVIYKNGEVSYQGRMPQDVNELIQRELG